MPLVPLIVRARSNSAALTRVFTPEFYDLVAAGLDALDWEEARTSFYQQREKYLNDHPYFQRVFSTEVRSTIANRIGSFFDKRVQSDFDVAAHKMVNGDYIGPHTDQNDLGERYRCTVTFNSGWEVRDGGVLLILRDGNVRNLVDAWLPTSNNGYVFETGDSSYHAVSPVVGRRPRYSLILTFKLKPDEASANAASKAWWPFPLKSDVEEARYNASLMGVAERSLNQTYETVGFSSVAEFRAFLRSPLQNAPSSLSYSGGAAKNVDEFGRQPKGTDSNRVARISTLQRIPPICIVRRANGCFLLVNGSHRLSYAVDEGLPIQATIFDEAAD